MRHNKGKKQRVPVKSRDWVLEKKARQRRQGRDVRPDTKYTGRKRGPKYAFLFSFLHLPLLTLVPDFEKLYYNKRKRVQGGPFYKFILQACSKLFSLILISS